MGRRAADLTTPVPVLGVPALVGVRGLKTTGGDRTGGALLQTWGFHCSVGVQTSPGISRPPTQHSVQLTDTPSTPSDCITETSNSYITKETEYKDILLLTKSDKEKRAILKQKSGESKTKKEVTFKALGGEASKDVACSQRNSSGTYCYARAIKTNPHFAGNVSNFTPKLKSAARYTNGSVVDSEAIGGITVDNDEAESVKGATSRGRDQTRLQGHYAEKSGKALPLSAARPFGMPQKICSHCGGRQSVTTGAATAGEKSPTADAFPLKSALTTLSTTTHFQMPQIERNRALKPTQHQIPDSITNTDNRIHITLNPQILYLNEELRYRKTPHRACPVHSKSNLVTLSHNHAARDATSTQPTNILHAKSLTVTKATIETRQDDASLKSFAKLTQDSGIPRPTSLTLTPKMATATKPNNPHSHTYPKLLKTSQHSCTQYNVPQNVCVSVHATPEKTHSNTTAAGPKITSNTNTHKTTMTFNNAIMSTKSVPVNVANAQQETTLLNSTHTARANIATNTTDSPQMTQKCPTLSKANNASDPFHKAETAAQHTPCPPCISPDPAQKPQEKLSSQVDTNPTAFTTFANTPNATTPHLSFVVPQSTLNNNATSDQTAHTSTKHNAKSVVRQIHLIHPNSSNSEPILHVSTASLNTASSATNPLNSRARLPSGATPSSTSTGNSTLYKSITLRNSSVSLKNSPSKASSSVNQSNVCESSTTLLQSTNTTREELSCNEASHTNKPGHTQATDIKTQANKQSDVCSVSNEENNSRTAPLALSKLLNSSKSHNRGGDASIHNPKSILNPNTENYTDKNKLNGNLINELFWHESKDHGNSNLSQVTNLQNYISLIKSTSSCLQGCINTEQQRLALYQGYTEAEHEGHCATCPPGKTAQETESYTEQFALGISARHANMKLKSNADKETHPSYSAPSVIAQTHCISSSPANTRAHVHPITQSSVHQNSDSDVSSLPQVHGGPELSFTAPAPYKSEGELCTRTGPECNSIFPSSTMHVASHPRLQSCEVDAIVRQDSVFSPAPPQPCPEDSSLAHSHPADAALLLPPSPQWCKSAALQQRLETVEASLAANKDRITTLLNIIHDLETCHTPTSGRRCFKTGQDLKNCSTCQKTACIVYRDTYIPQRPMAVAQ
ncbi:histamine receptor H2b isoform X3 [Xiphias gladius]|uniref:histamine receptor H2b isoform X3 n=1 Tax=Xiphias gladius TaxID=8245 RepID=UPI001A9837F8|nr:histamine receptor H2b isoform X3 [Xiphias gladius]